MTKYHLVNVLDSLKAILRFLFYPFFILMDVLRGWFLVIAKGDSHALAQGYFSMFFVVSLILLARGELFLSFAFLWASSFVWFMGELINFGKNRKGSFPLPWSVTKGKIDRIAALLVAIGFIGGGTFLFISTTGSLYTKFLGGLLPWLLGLPFVYAAVKG